MTSNKHSGSSFEQHLIDGLRESDELVFLHVKEALESPNISEPNDYKYLIKAIGDVAEARGKSELAKNADLTRQGLYRMLAGDTVPNIRNVMALLEAIGLKFSIERIGQVIGEVAPASVLDVAEYASNLLPRNSTCMKLQKIVYYSQVESLVSYNEALFAEPIQAWMAGPVAPALYYQHKGRRTLHGLKFGNPSALSVKQKACIERAVQKYGTREPEELSHLTHIEAPWKEARGELHIMARSSAEITHESIRAYYGNLPDYSELDVSAEE